METVILKKCFLAIVALVLLCGPAVGEEVDAEKKAKLIARLLELTGKPESELVDTMIPPLKPIARNVALKSLMPNKTLTATEREQKANELTERLLKRFHELMMKAGIKKEIDGICSEYLSSHFTGEELQFLITFYESDTGKSTLTKLPVCVAESQQLLQVKLKPEFDRVAKEVFAPPSATTTK